MQDLKLSVLMCVYHGDKAEYFDQALKSIYDQTRPADEVVLVVDGPVSDDINRVINKYVKKNDNFKVYRLKNNRGLGIAKKVGFKKCQYEYIATADADDIYVNNRFEKQMDFFKKNPNLSVVGSGCYHFTDTIEKIMNEERFPINDKEIKKKLKTGCPICHPVTILKKADVEKAGGYKDWYYNEDYYLWIRMLLNDAVFANVPETLMYVRTTPEQMKRRGGLKYFVSIKKLYDYMLCNHVINIPIYLFNVSSRFVVQVLMPASIRSVIRKIIQ